MVREQGVSDRSRDLSARPEGAPPATERCGGPAFWEEWRGTVPDEEIEFIRAVFEDFCGSWE